MHRINVFRARGLPLALGLALAAALVSCGRRSEEKRVDNLLKVFPAETNTAEVTAPVAVNAGAGSEQTSVTAGRTQAEEAVEAIRSSNYVEAVTTLRSMQNQPQLSTKQRAAIQDSMAVVQRRLAVRLQQGDPQAAKAAEDLRKAVAH